MLFILLVGFGLQILFNISHPDNYLIKYSVNIIFILLEFGILVFVFSKNGFIINEQGLFKTYFFVKKPFFKNHIDLINKPKLSILEKRKSQRLPSISVIYPRPSFNFVTYDLFILNNNHTSKYEIISLDKKENATKAVDFLTKYLNLKSENYSPNYRKRTCG